MHVSQIEIRIEFIWDIDIFQSYFLMCFTKIGLLTCLDFLKKQFQKKKTVFTLKSKTLLIASCGAYTKGIDAFAQIQSKWNHLGVSLFFRNK